MTPTDDVQQRTRDTTICFKCQVSLNNYILDPNIPAKSERSTTEKSKKEKYQFFKDRKTPFAVLFVFKCKDQVNPSILNNGGTLNFPHCLILLKYLYSTVAAWPVANSGAVSNCPTPNNRMLTILR